MSNEVETKEQLATVEEKRAPSQVLKPTRQVHSDDLTGTLEKLKSSNQELREQNRLLIEQNAIQRKANEKLHSKLAPKNVKVKDAPKDKDFFDDDGDDEETDSEDEDEEDEEGEE